MRVLRAALLIATVSMTLSAESPFAGTWKQDRSKSELDPNGRVWTIESDGDGIKLVSAMGPVYGGPLDGSNRAGLGVLIKDTFTLKTLSERSYEATQIRDGKTLAKQVMEVSPDGSVLTESFTVYTFREPATTISTFNRKSGNGEAHPYIGTWVGDPSKTKWSSDNMMTITEDGDTLILQNPASDNQTVLDLATSNVMIKGPTPPAPDATQSVKKIDDHSFQVNYSRGELKSTTLYSVSEDGDTLTLTTTSTGPTGRTLNNKLVYERQ